MAKMRRVWSLKITKTKIIRRVICGGAADHMEVFSARYIKHAVVDENAGQSINKVEQLRTDCFSALCADYITDTPASQRTLYIYTLARVWRAYPWCEAAHISL